LAWDVHPLDVVAPRLYASIVKSNTNIHSLLHGVSPEIVAARISGMITLCVIAYILLFWTASERSNASSTSKSESDVHDAPPRGEAVRHCVRRYY
jgi:hypothetical protein